MRFLISKFFELFTLIPKNLKLKLFNKLLRVLNDKDDHFYYTYNYRDKFIKLKKRRKKNGISIIIQGPIIRKNNFTINSAKLYLNNCDSDIIISTWEDELSEEEINYLKKRGIYIVLSKYPKITGPYNLNYQIRSTHEGLKVSNKLKNKFSIKTRSDCRIYLENFDLNLFNFFEFSKKVKKTTKIGSTSFTVKKRLYGISDFIVYGKTKDLLNYFPKPFLDQDFKIFKKFIGMNKKNKKDFSKIDFVCYPENFLCYNYLKKYIDKKIKYSYLYYSHYLSKYFTIIDNSNLDLFWYKYNHQFEYRDKQFVEDKINKDKFVNFFEWLKNKKLR